MLPSDESDSPFSVVDVGFRGLDRMDWKGGAVYGNVNFTPCATLAGHVLFNLPFTFAEIFRPVESMKRRRVSRRS